MKSQAQERNPIGPFVGRWRFLSNFFSVDIEFDGMTYGSVEHAFQAAKTMDRDERTAIRDAHTPGEAKRLGRTLDLRADWDVVRDDVMLMLLRRKFAVPSLRESLLQTGERALIELNEWGDTYWGVSDGVGRNRLGELLEQVRVELAGDD